MDKFDSISSSRLRPAVAGWLMVVVVWGAVAAGAASAAGAGDAAVDADTLQRVVRYSPGSLATESGARQLYARLVKASEEVCPGNFSGPRFLSGAVLECRRRAVDGAVRRIGSPRLAAVHAARTGNG